jgi:hypothetical protein
MDNQQNTELKLNNYRIRRTNGTYLNTGSDLSSWMTLEEARQKVDYDLDEIIVYHNGAEVLFEVF